MSFDLYVSKFRGGEAAEFPVSALRDAFGPFIVETAPDGFDLKFSEQDGCTLFVDTGAQAVDSFSVSRPGADPRLYEALFAVLQVPGCVLIVPGDCPPLTGHPETASNLPPDMIESLGAPVLLQSSTEIPARILAA